MGHRRLRTFIASWHVFNERIIVINIILLGSRITIMGVNAMNKDTLANIKESFLEQLYEGIIKIGSSLEIIDLSRRVG